MTHLVDFDPGNAEVGPQPDVQECDCGDGKHHADEQDFGDPAEWADPAEADPWSGVTPDQLEGYR